MDEFFHSDYVQREPPNGMGPGLDGLRQWLGAWMQAFPDVRWTVEEQIGEDDQVWSRSTSEGKHRGAYLGRPPTGKKVTATVWTINRFAAGKIAEGRMLGDRLGLMRQLGVKRSITLSGMGALRAKPQRRGLGSGGLAPIL